MVLWRIRTEIDDDPGRLAALTAALAAYGGNVLGLSVQAVEGGVVDEFFVDLPAVVPEAQVMGALAFAGGRNPVAVPADMHDLVDAPARALRLAQRVREDPDDLPEVLAELLGAQECEWLPDGRSPALDDGDHDTAVLMLSTASGRMLALRRYALPFTVTEVARAEAMVDFHGPVPEAHSPPAALIGWVALPDGTEVLLRPAAADDRPAVVAMHERCSSHSRYMRYFTPARRMPEWAVERLVGGERGQALVALDPHGEVVALANLMPGLGHEQGQAHGPGHGQGYEQGYEQGRNTDTAEVALLVEDAWQGRRIGTMLFRRLVAAAADAGVRELTASVLPSNARMWRLLRRAGLMEEHDAEIGVLRLRGQVEDILATMAGPTLAGSAM